LPNHFVSRAEDARPSGRFILRTPLHPVNEPEGV
jgi:hypothetical protein